MSTTLGHVSTVTVSDEVHDILSTLHTELSAPLMEAAIGELNSDKTTNTLHPQ